MKTHKYEATSLHSSNKLQSKLNFLFSPLSFRLFARDDSHGRKMKRVIGFNPITGTSSRCSDVKLNFRLRLFTNIIVVLKIC